jgi:AcrR family transcriptional regulator
MARKTSLSNSDRVSRGEGSRNRILNQAIQMASEEGLEALTIGQMSAKLGMSKSGLFAHFGSKEKLQLATIERAQGIFETEVLAGVEEGTQGVALLWSLCDLWLKHLEHRVFPTGYFFTGAFMEYGERRGPLTRRLRAVIKTWLKSLKLSVEQAQDLEELRTERTAQEMAFELAALLVGAYWAHLAGSGDAYRTARLAILSRFRNWAAGQVPPRALSGVSTWERYLRRRARAGPGK